MSTVSQESSGDRTPLPQLETRACAGDSSVCEACERRCIVRSTGLAALGVLCVGLGAVGVLVPGLPTTVFLIVACWCFARSVPWLEERLVRVPLFRPFLAAVDGDGGMPKRAKVISLVLMWGGMSLSMVFILLGDAPAFVPAVVLASGVFGTYWIVWRVPGECASACVERVGGSGVLEMKSALSEPVRVHAGVDRGAQERGSRSGDREPAEV